MALPVAPDLSGWVPLRIFWREEPASLTPWIEWFYLGSARFVEPFFESTANEALRVPFNKLFRHQTPVAAAGEWATANSALKPTGFIFHMGRCGSTLISQMLASSLSNIVISEAGPVDAIARSHVRAPYASDEQRCEWMRSVVSAFGQRRSGDEIRYFIKFDATSTFAMPLIRRAFPDVPWIFMHRNPAEVLVSQIRTPSALMMPDPTTPAVVGISAHEIATMTSAEEYAARVIGRLCESAVEHVGDPLGMYVDYAELPSAVYGRIARHFGLEFSPAELAAMQDVSQLNAKRPKERFSGDSREKRKEAEGELAALCRQWIQPHYEKLRAARVSALPKASK